MSRLREGRLAWQDKGLCSGIHELPVTADHILLAKGMAKEDQHS